MGKRFVSPTKPQSKPLPHGAWPVKSVRQDGFKPAGAVIVSYIGPTPWEGTHVFCESGKAYDWSWSRGLELVIVVKPGVDAIDAIRGCYWPEAKTLTTVIDIERELVSMVLGTLPKPTLWHRKDVSDYFPQEAVCN